MIKNIGYFHTIVVGWSLFLFLLSSCLSLLSSFLSRQIMVRHVSCLLHFFFFLLVLFFFIRVVLVKVWCLMSIAVLSRGTWCAGFTEEDLFCWFMRLKSRRVARLASRRVADCPYQFWSDIDRRWGQSKLVIPLAVMDLCHRGMPTPLATPALLSGFPVLVEDPHPRISRQSGGSLFLVFFLHLLAGGFCGSAVVR